MLLSSTLPELRRRGRAIGSFVLFAGKRFAEDRCQVVAASLSYTSLLAMVPLLAIVLSVLAAVPQLEHFWQEIRGFLIDNLMPESGNLMAGYFDGFIANARNMKGFGIAGLVVVAMLLINTIFKEMNVIFRVEKARPVWLRVIVYAVVLIGGPLVLAVSFSLATYIFAQTKVLGSDQYGVAAFTGFFGWLARFVPALLLIAGFTLFYRIVPNRRVAWRDALAGGLLAGLLFSGLRWTFGVYLVYFPTYKVLYGALSAVPVFLLWMFLSWTVVLLGAVTAAALPVWRANRRRPS